MDLMRLGAQVLVSNLSGGATNIDKAMSALSGLLGNGEGGIDLGSMVTKMQGGNLASMASSWLGSGSNEIIGANQLRKLFGDDKISQFASQLGTDEDTALGGLSEALPKMMDQGSPDGSLLDSLGGVGRIAGMASSFLK